MVEICRGITLFLLPVLALYLLLYISEPSTQILITMLGVVAMVPIAQFSSYIARRNNPTLASHILIPGLMVVLAINSLLIHGLVVVVGPVYIALIVIAGMLLDPGQSYISAAIASSLWVLAYTSEQRGWVAQATLSDPIGIISMLVIGVLVFFFVAILSRISTDYLRRRLDDATYDLVQANRQLEEANKLKSQFTARTSHELRTPLSAIIVFTDLALRGVYGPLTDKLRDSLERVLLSARRLRDLIEDILDISKIEAGELEIVEEAFPLKNLETILHSELDSKAAEKALAFTVTLSPELPERIIGDEKRLSQIAINLTHNAIKFTTTGSVHVKIQPFGERQWQLQVRDTGRGIMEENFETIFDEFRQEMRTSQEPGTGLGLAITRNLVLMMRGTIGLQSEVGKGSTFTVTLPLKPATVAEAEQPVEA